MPGPALRQRKPPKGAFLVILALRWEWQGSHRQSLVQQTGWPCWPLAGAGHIQLAQSHGMCAPSGASHLSTVSVQVPSEVAVLEAVKVYHHYNTQSNGMRDECIVEKVRPNSLRRCWLELQFGSIGELHLFLWLSQLSSSTEHSAHASWNGQPCVPQTVHLSPGGARWQQGGVLPAC